MREFALWEVITGEALVVEDRSAEEVEVGVGVSEGRVCSVDGVGGESC